MIECRADSPTFQQLADDLIGRGVSFCFEARGCSMWPTIRNGEVLHVAPAKHINLRVGDIVLLRTGDGFKAHRIVCRQGQSFVTRGDASAETDGIITREQIVGQVIAKECRKTGRLSSLNAANNRLRFFARELRRSLAIPRKLERLLRIS